MSFKCLDKLGRRPCDDDIAQYQHVEFRVKRLAVCEKSGSVDFDIRLYNILVQPGRAPEDALVRVVHEHFC